MRIRGAVLERTGGPLTVCELDLAPPEREEVLVRLHVSGVCHSDYNAVDGTVGDELPGGARPRGRRCRGGGRRACDSCASRRSRGSVLDAVVRRMRGVPPRSSPAVLDSLAGDGHGRSDGRNATAVARRQARLSLLLPLDVRRRLCRASALMRSYPEGRPVRCRRARRMCRDDRGRRRVANRAGAARRPRRRRRLRRRRPVRADGRGRRGGGARDRGGRCPAEARRGAVVRRHARRAVGREPGGDRRGRARRVPRRRRLCDRGHGSSRGHGGGVPLDPCARRGRAHRHPASRTPCCPFRRRRSRAWSAACSVRSTARRSPSATSRSRWICTAAAACRSTD